MKAGLKGTGGAEGWHPLKILAVGIAATVIVLGAAGWYSWSTHQGITRLVTADLRLQELRGTILQFDEVLTMSARMAAATGDHRWEERYRRFEPALDAAIKETIALAPELYESEAAAQTDAANIALVNLENQAFALVHQGKADVAMQLLLSAAYQDYKEAYADGMEKLDTALANRVHQHLDVHHGRVLWLGLLALGAVGILLLGWTTVFVSVRTHLKRRMLAERALENAHRDLELRVDERTDDLAQANRDLKTEIIERRQAEQELRAAKEQADAHACRAKQAVADMERMNAVMMGREERVLEVKQEVNDLLVELGQERKYEHV